VTSVLLQVRSGSIVIDVRVFMSQPLASSLLTAASLSGALGVNITNIVSTYSILEIQAPSPPPPSPPPSPPPPSPPPSPPPPSMPPTEMVRALELFYEATGGNAWRNNFKWLSGEPCVDGWFGVHCCPQELPVLRGDDECTAEGGGATGVRTTQGSAACHSGGGGEGGGGEGSGGEGGGGEGGGEGGGGEGGGGEGGGGGGGGGEGEGGGGEGDGGGGEGEGGGGEGDGGGGEGGGGEGEGGGGEGGSGGGEGHKLHVARQFVCASAKEQQELKVHALHG
jgi:hypothetical protein